jgi:hypothetical protein
MPHALLYTGTHAPIPNNHNASPDHHQDPLHDQLVTNPNYPVTKPNHHTLTNPNYLNLTLYYLTTSNDPTTPNDPSQ